MPASAWHRPSMLEKETYHVQTNNCTGCNELLHRYSEMLQNDQMLTNLKPLKVYNVKKLTHSLLRLTS